MAKIAVTPSIVLAEFVLYRKRVSMAKVSALFLRCLYENIAMYVGLVEQYFG